MPLSSRFREKIKQHRTEVEQAGVSWFAAASPLRRILWALGFEVRPSFYVNDAVNLLESAVMVAPVAVLWLIMLEVWLARPATAGDFGEIATAVLLALVLGHSRFVRERAKVRLSNWA